MMRKLIVPVFAAVALVMVMGTVALAADTPTTPPNSASQCVNFVDADGDGICDNASQQAGQGTGLGQNSNGAFVDADGDGVCDKLGQNVPARDGTGSRNGGGNGQRGGRR